MITLLSIYNYIFSNKEKVVVTEKVMVVEVLSPGAMTRLRAKLEPPIISNSDSDQQAAYRLGIQRALLTVEKEFSHL